MANIKENEGDLAKPLTEAYPDQGFTEVDARVKAGLNPENPGFASQAYQGQGIDAPQYEEQRAMENQGDTHFTDEEE
ncbi:MAG: hypothetical protein AAF311_13045 [Pseudomonadota bacterium]